MGMYIKDMDLPKAEDEMIELAIFGNGDVLITGESWRNPEDGKCYYGLSNDKNVYKAIEVQEPHGRLIDADALIDKILGMYAFDNSFRFCMKGILLSAPTVIPASEEE